MFLNQIKFYLINYLVCMKNGLVLGPCGPRSIRMRPTLVFEKRHAQETLHLLEKVMTEYSSWDDHVTKKPWKIKIWLPKFQPLPKSRRRSACYCRIWQLYLNKITAIRNKIPIDIFLVYLIVKDSFFVTRTFCNEVFM